MHAGLRDVFVVHAVALRAAAADDFASVRALLIVHRAYYAFVQREALEELHEACLREVQETANFVKWMLPWGVPHSVRDLPALRIDNRECVVAARRKAPRQRQAGHHMGLEPKSRRVVRRRQAAPRRRLACRKQVPPRVVHQRRVAQRKRAPCSSVRRCGRVVLERQAAP